VVRVLTEHMRLTRVEAVRGVSHQLQVHSQVTSYFLMIACHQEIKAGAGPSFLCIAPTSSQAL